MAKHKPTALKFPLKAALRDKGTNAKVTANIRPMLESDLEKWAEWPYATEDLDKTWRWNKILKESKKTGGIECYALFVDDALHGLVSFDLQGHLTDAGRGLIVDYLATNPRNRRGKRGVKDVGEVFLGLAVYRSRELGWEGRLWLESLSTAEAFYEHAGFAQLPSRSKDGYVTFVLGKAGADRIWRDVIEAEILYVSG